MNIHDPNYYKQKKKHEKEKQRKQQLTKEFKRMLKAKEIEKYEPFGKYHDVYEISQNCKRLYEHEEAIKLAKSERKKQRHINKTTKLNSRIKKVKQSNKISYYVVYTD